MSMPVIECKKIDKCCAAASVLQSIALQETALAHILNAEGEKLQKIIASCNAKKDDLLEVNSSVESMVDKIISLELVLKSKIDLVIPLLDDCKHKRPYEDEVEEKTFITD